MPSNTFAARVSAASRPYMSTSSVLRIVSGSLPSTTSCRPLRRKASGSPSIRCSSPSRPWRREMLLQSTILRAITPGSFAGGRNTHGSRFRARFMTSIGVWMQIAATVPTTTIMKAAADTSACTPAPLSMAPRMIAMEASATPSMLSTSMPAVLVLPLAEQRLQSQQRLAMQLAHARFRHLEHRADFLEIEFPLVVQRQHQALALRQFLYRIDDRLPQRIHQCHALRIQCVVGQAIQSRVFAVLAIVEAQQLAAQCVLDDVLVFIEAHAHLRGHVGLGGLAAAAALDLAQRHGRGPRLALSLI